MSAPDQIAVAVVVNMTIGFAKPHHRLVGAAQSGEGQLGRWNVRHDISVSRHHERGCGDLAQHRGIVDLAISGEHMTISQVRRELAKSAWPGILERIPIKARHGEPVDVFVRVVKAIDQFHAGDSDERQRSAQAPGTGDQG